MTINNKISAEIMQQMIESARETLLKIKDRAAKIITDATPHNNPAASVAEGAINEADNALVFYEIDPKRPDFLEAAAEAVEKARPHTDKARAFLAQAEEWLADPIFPKNGDPE